MNIILVFAATCMVAFTATFVTVMIVNYKREVRDYNVYMVGQFMELSKAHMENGAEDISVEITGM